MRRPPRFVRPAALATALALFLVACGGSSGKKSSSETTSPGAKQGGVFRLGVVEPTAIDPYNSQESEGILVTKQVFTGLVEIDNATSQIKPGVATTWDKNGDCTQWTFHLRPGTTFTNGEAVDANAFIRGMTRAAKQAAASDVAYHMAGIAGYTDIHGTGDANSKATATTFSGLSAPDPNTLVVKLSAADCEFDKKTLQPVMSPVPTVAGDATNKTFNDMPIGNGPFKMKEPWHHDQGITLLRNDGYFGTKAHLDEVDITIQPSQDALQAEYKGLQSGQYDYARLPPELIPQAKSAYEPKGGFLHKLTYGINYLLVNVVNPPLNKAEARKAISLAIDRQAIIDGVFKGLQTKATSIIPPPLKDYYSANVCDTCDKPDVAKAKQMAAESGIPPGTKVSLSFNTGGGHEAWVQAVQQELQQNLGLKVDIPSMPFAELLKQEKADNASGLFRAAWSADYPSAENFLFPLLSQKSLPPGDNRGRYVSKAFDDLLSQSRATPDDAQRASLIKQAEKIAIGDDLALIPMWYRDQYRAFDSTKWTGLDIDFFENATLATIGLK
ncbi:MAG: ABC transporter substrate-binding protein [Actinobacteria bacterium]|nr:ABC transporter substrate-binding protein [Actinomycetota bacterium]